MPGHNTRGRVNSNPAPDPSPLGGDRPNLSTGNVAVPGAPTAITAQTAYLSGAWFKNTDVVERTVLVTDTAGNQIAKVILAPDAEASYPWDRRPAAGVKWSADGAGVKGHVWGFL